MKVRVFYDHGWLVMQGSMLHVVGFFTWKAAMRYAHTGKIL